MKIYFFLSSYLIILQNNWFANTQTCTSFPYVPGPTPAPNFPQKYSTRVEVNQLEDDATYEMRAYYDYSKKKAALDLKENNIWKRLIFNYETDEIYLLTSRPTLDVPLVPPPDEQPLYETSCETYSLKENLSLNYYFGYSGFSYLYPKSANTFFRFEPNSRSYEGEDNVRGILCDVYVGCQYNEATKANYTIKHYFSKPNITFPGNNNTFPRVILRAKYSGMALKSDGSLKKFTNTFDYHEFRLDFDRDDIFQTPGRVYCENRKKVGVKPPVIKGNLKFSEEIVSKGIISHITNIEFDAQLQIVRYETRERFGNNSEINFDKYPHIFVNDFTIGVSYIKNKHTGRCTIQTLDPFAFASDSNFTQAMLDSGNGYAIRSKSAESLLELDLDYIFTGQRAIDGLTSDIFIAKSDISKGISIVNEYIFSPQNFTTQTVGQREKNIPKRLAKKSLTSDFSSVSTFYNFETNEINIRNFDVTNCYGDDSLISFKIVLKPRTDIYLQILRRINLNKVLPRKIYVALGNLTGEISLRFSIPRVTLTDDGYVYVRSSILPGPEPLKLFKLFPNKLLTSTGFTYSSNVQSAEACALKCLASTECLSFDYSNSSKGCYLNKKHYSNGTFSTFTTTYDHYSRNSLLYVKFSEKYIIWSDMSIKFNNNRTSIETEVTDFENHTYPIVLDAVSIEEVKKDENRFGSTFYLSKYNLKKPNFRYKKNNDDLYIKTNIDDCAKKCTEEIGSPCNSFHFCFLTSECLLNKNVIDDESSDFEQNDYCDIYEKDSLSHYSFFKTKATINPNDKKIISVPSPNECATKCDNELDIHCRSFNYCPNTRECYLSDRHLIDGSIESSSNLLCDHYSRKYISDFSYIDTNEIPLSGEIVFKDMINIDVCSFECINSDGFNCKSFDYCPDSKTCILNSGQKPIESAMQSNKKDKCAHYRREYFFVTSSKSGSSDSSKSVLAALSIIFGLLSVVIGGIASILLIKRYGQKSL